MLKYQVAKDNGELAQLVERCDRTAEVRSSNLLFSISLKPVWTMASATSKGIIQSKGRLWIETLFYHFWLI